MKRPYLFTSESVSEGHPDKVCDRISDTVVDAYLSADPLSRVACETLATTNKVVLAGEVRGPSIDKDNLIDQVRECIKDIGYEQKGFHWKNCEIENHLHEQSSDIAMGVDSGSNKDEGAGDQGIMFGFACKDTESLMPAPIYYAHQILLKMAQARKNKSNEEFEPDSKSQITMLYENGKPKKVASVVVSTQHKEGLSPGHIKDLVRPIVYDCIPENLINELKDKDFYVNPTGNFVIGGPDGDSGLTGRKIIVDTYGGAAPHGGGAFSGKDPSKVDRSAAYAARYLAKNIVAANLAEECVIQLSYAIGISKPLSIYINTNGTSQVDETKIENLIPELFDLSPRGIREHLQLSNPIYVPTSAYGHFGRTPTMQGHFTWEKTDLVESFKNAF
ncbi:MAG: methionine adenosyltransferase [Alphaproteobacteria bacterium]|jgi:S-adenosylmethionine synthetase|nr:methionine adenosyltransferase [Alphaproteobacteria bacterium]PPR55763.1 MAG: S-adenosylmethionine synthase [Alphaproteobacteria bacterium MarineAlpha5_Bin3]